MIYLSRNYQQLIANAFKFICVSFKYVICALFAVYYARLVAKFIQLIEVNII